MKDGCLLCEKWGPGVYAIRYGTRLCERCDNLYARWDRNHDKDLSEILKWIARRVRIECTKRLTAANVEEKS